MDDNSFSSDDSDEKRIRLSTSFNSHHSRSESSSHTHSPSSWSNSSSSSPISSPSVKQDEGDAEQLENLIGIKQRRTCEVQVCGKKVINMISHMKRMHGEGTPGFAVPCGQCDMIVLLSALGKHVLEHHMDTEQRRSLSPPPPLSDEELTEEEDKNLVSRTRSCQSQSPHKKKSNLSLPNPPTERPYIRVSHSLNFMFGDKNISSGKDPVVSETSEIDRKQTLSRIELDQSGGQDEEGTAASATEPAVDDKDNNNNDVSPEVVKDNKCIEFLIKTKDRGRNGEEVKNMKLKVAPSKTVSVVKKRYMKKLGLDKDKLGELQFIVNGRKLEEEELVEKLDNVTVMADGLWFR